MNFALILGIASLTLSASAAAHEESVEEALVNAESDTEHYFNFTLENGTVVQALLQPQLTFRVPASDPTFWHYTNNETEGREISVNCTDCLSQFNREAQTVFIVHGFTGSRKGVLPDSLREALFSRPTPFNVIIVDWGSLAMAPFYATAAENTKIVGKFVAEMIVFLTEKKVTTMDKITYIGHSLGSHVGNFASENLPKDKKLPRLFALDPALPLFGSLPKAERLESSDALFVIVVHTAAGRLLKGGLGFVDSIGHVDFFPNAGRYQPGCSKIDFGTCSHGRSYLYLAEAIRNPSAFPACKCKSWAEFDNGKCKCDDENKVYFGFDIPKTTRGDYYFRTNSKPPFGQGK